MTGAADQIIEAIEQRNLDQALELAQTAEERVDAILLV